MASPRWTFLLMLPALVLPASATTFCCVGADGRRICGDVMPAQCLNRAYQEYGSQGTVIKQHEAPLTPEQRVVREAEMARKRAEERRLADEERHDRALLTSYASVKDIELKRDRTIAEAESQLRAVQDRYDRAVARRGELAKETEFYTKKPVPESLKTQIRENEADITGFQSAIESRKKDIVDVAARFDEEQRHYLSLQEKYKAAVSQPH